MKKILSAVLILFLFACGCGTPDVVSGSSEPMTQTEYDDFAANVLPAACILICGQQERRPNDLLEYVDDIIYEKIDDEYLNIIKNLKTEFSKYFTKEFVEDYFKNTFGKNGIYAQSGIRVYVNPQNTHAGGNDVNQNFYQDPVSKKNIIEFDKILNDNKNVIHYYFEIERVEGIWMISAAHFKTLSISEFSSKIPAKKPVIYLYPEKITDVTVKLDLNGKLGCTYPKYPKGGWKVTAYPGGKLIVGGEEYNYLFWEGELNTVFTFDKGFCVKGADTAAFLKKALSEMGLIPSEYNDFIVYWLPQMEKNAFNLISFVGMDYTENAKLEITPKPDSTLRVFMIFKPLEKPVTITPQTFEKFERNGFTVVEWGGAQID